MEELKEEYKDIISAWLPTYAENQESIVLSISIRFKDNSRLEAKEKFIKELQDCRYSYQWMKEDNSLLICWDNAPNHPKIPTHPHHQHIATRQNIQPSESMNLQKVLLFIGKVLGIFAMLTLTAWLVKS